MNSCSKFFKDIFHIPALTQKINKRLILILEQFYTKERVSDKIFLTLMFRLRKGEWIRWKNPVTFSEKQQWLKLYNRDSRQTMLTDKVLVKDWVGKRIGYEHIIPTLEVWNNVDEIDFNKLEFNTIIKCNHGSGPPFFAFYNEASDTGKIKEKLRKAMLIDYSKHAGEWHYKNIERKILIEKNINPLNELIDYKFFCFNGCPKFIKVVIYRENDQNSANYYDLKWNLIDISQANWPADFSLKVKRPKNLEKMIDIAFVLSKDFPFIRIDLYNLNGKIFFGEMTFYQGAGFTKWLNKKTDKYLGEMLLI